jgi:hypothetical protein
MNHLGVTHMHHGGAGRSMTFFMAFHFMSLLPGPDSTGGQKQKKQGNKKQLSTSLDRLQPK